MTDKYKQHEKELEKAIRIAIAQFGRAMEKEPERKYLRILTDVLDDALLGPQMRLDELDNEKDEE